MKLTKIEILHFGKLNNLTFDLDSNLNVFLGQNEAGKSTTVAFIKQILFGFHLRNNKSTFFEDYQPLSKVSPMGGKLYFSDKQDKFELERLYTAGQSKRGTLKVWLNGQEVPEEVFFDRIKNIDGNFYTDSFMFNQEMLAQVYGLNQADLMERIYFLGASQSNKLLELRKSFSDKASSLFKKTGRKPIINQLLNQVEDKEDEIKNTEAEFDDYQRHLQENTVLSNKLNDQKAKLAEIIKQQEEINLLKQKLANFNRYQELTHKLTPIDFSNEAFEQAKNLQYEIKNLEESVSNLKERLNSIENSTKNLSNLNTLEDLLAKKAQLLQWESEYRQLEKDIKSSQEEIAQLEEFDPNVSKLKDLNSAQLEELKNEYNDLKKSSNTANKDKNIPLISWIFAAVFLVLGVVTQKLLLILALIALGVGWYFKTKGQNDQQDKIKHFEQKYNLNFESFNLDAAFSQLFQIDSKKQRLTNNQDELEELKQKVNSFSQKLQQALEANFNPQMSLIENLNKVEQEINQLKISNQEKDQIKVELKTKISNLNLLKQKLQTIFAQNKVTDFAEFIQLKDQNDAQEKLKLEIQALKNNIGTDFEKLQNLADNETEFEIKENKLNAQRQEIQDKIDDLQSQIAKNVVNQENLANSDTVLKQNQEMATIQSQLRDESIDYLSDLLVSNWIGRSLDIASNERFPKMIESAKNYFSILTGHRYVGLELKKKITVIDKNKKKKEAKYLSRATSQQLYFALKLAFVEQISDEIELPILIDDAFVDFDNQRTEYVVELLEKLATHTQVLIFTHRKELTQQLKAKELLFS